MSNLDHTLAQIFGWLVEAPDVYKLLPKILDAVMLATKAERGQIELYDKTGETLFSKARKEGGDIADRRKSKISGKILAWVKEKNETVLSPAAKSDARFRDSNTILGQNVLSVVCAPLRDESGTFGVLYIDNSQREALFSATTKSLLEQLAQRLAPPLRQTIARQEEQKRLARELQHARDRERGYATMIGTSSAIQKVLEELAFAQTHEDNVLIFGESGTGKELTARLGHRHSARGDKPFVAFDCATVPEDILISTLFGHERGAFTGAIQKRSGLAYEAQGGTLFLDEIGNVSARVQAMLLEFLEHKTYRPLGSNDVKQADVRLMFATNENLAELVEEKRFRKDLYFRLKKSITLTMPPLRERGEDVLLLAEYFLEHVNTKYKTNVRLGAETRDYLLRYSYPGNVRELETIMYDAVRAAIRANHEIILPQHLPSEVINGNSVPHCETTAVGLKFGAEDFYAAKYLPQEFQAHAFIRGAESELANGAATVAAGERAHEHLLLSLKPALELPLKPALRAAAFAFERNYLLALLQSTKGKQHEAIKRARIHKSAFINKMKKHDLHIRKNPFDQGER